MAHFWNEYADLGIYIKKTGVSKYLISTHPIT